MGPKMIQREYCPRCGGAKHALQCRSVRYGGVDWVALMAYQVRDGHEMTLAEIGEVAGISRERVRQIEFDALRKLAGRPGVRKVVAGILGP